jgi:hypothetical protein
MQAVQFIMVCNVIYCILKIIGNIKSNSIEQQEISNAEDT